MSPFFPAASQHPATQRRRPAQRKDAPTASPPSRGASGRFRFAEQLRTPGIRRSRALRRLAAIACLLLAGVLALGARFHESEKLVTYAREVQPGHRLVAEDLTLTAIDPATAPSQGVTDAQELVGKIALTRRTPGLLASEDDVLDPALTARAVHEPAAQPGAERSTMVPLTLAEAQLIEVLRPGDSVSVVSARDDSTEPQVIATDATVVFAGGMQEKAAQRSPGVVLLLLPEESANAVASASLSLPLTVVFTGERAAPSRSSPTRD